MEISSLGYLGFESPSAKEWETFGPEVFGLGLNDPEEDGTVYLRMDDRHHRIAIHPGEEDRLAYIGWELRDKAAFRAAVAELQQKGVEHRLAEPGECQQRRVQAFVRVRDPFDYVHELYYAPTFTHRSFRPGKPSAGFVAGEHGAGHVVVVVPDWTDELERFVTGVLGFELFAGYLAPLPGGGQAGPQFFRCNRRTHCIGYLALPGMRGVHHVCLEANSVDDVGIAWDLVQEREYPITMSLGRHMMDTLISFYFRSPSGFDIEFGAGGMAVEDGSFVQLNPSTPEVWGHKFLTPGFPPTVQSVVAG